MKRNSSRLIVVVTTAFLVFTNLNLFAHNPPSCGQTDCGLISGSKFYSQYYSPGNPDGTPLSANGGTWTKTSNNSCGSYNYYGTNYVLYPHKFICSVPIDDDMSFVLLGIGVLGFYSARKQLLSSLIF